MNEDRETDEEPSRWWGREGLAYLTSDSHINDQASPAARPCHLRVRSSPGLTVVGCMKSWKLGHGDRKSMRTI